MAKFRFVLTSAVAMVSAAVSHPALAETDNNYTPVTFRSGPAGLFGTVTVPANIARYTEQWQRARQDSTWHPMLRRLVEPARGLSREQQVAYVQKAVHSTIGWRSDATEWGQRDYWASAAQTLERGYGDMEDRAIVKMQALRALGFGWNDLFMTMGRDKVGGPITVLVVGTPSGFLILDDLGGAPIPAHRREGFEPWLSFSGDNSWLHGRRRADAGSRGR